MDYMKMPRSAGMLRVNFSESNFVQYRYMAQST
jgi:hypothetical protein